MTCHRDAIRANGAANEVTGWAIFSPLPTALGVPLRNPWEWSAVAAKTAVDVLAADSGCIARDLSLAVEPTVTVPTKLFLRICISVQSK